MKSHRAAVLLALFAVPARAQTGDILRPGALWRSWSFDPGILIPLVLSLILFAAGANTSRGVSRIRIACFAAGWMVLALSLLSPLHELGEVLFSAHMTQHELLMLAAAPLLVLSRPLVPLLWGLPFELRRALGHWSKRPAVQQTWHAMTRPFSAWWIHAAALWLWHIPRFFQATLTSDWIHAAQHLSFFVSALLFWWSLFYARGRAGYGAGVLYIFTTAIHTSILGALLTFSNTVWYPAYRFTSPAWGLSPLEDQQVGGLIMWIPASVVYLAAGLALVALWIRESGAVAERRIYAH